MVKALKGSTYREFLRSLGFLSLEKRMMRDDLISAYNFLSGVRGERGVVLLCLVASKGMREWNKAVSGLDIRKSFFMQRVGYSNRLSQGSGHGAIPVRLQGAPGQCS